MSAAVLASGEAALRSLVEHVQAVQDEAAGDAGSNTELPERLQRMKSQAEAHWSEAAAAVAVLEDLRQRGAPPQSGDGAASEAAAALFAERQILMGQLAQRNGELKRQIDHMRQLLCDVQLMGGNVGTGGDDSAANANE